MKRIIFILLTIILSIIVFSCEGFFLTDLPYERINPEDPETTAVITGASEINIKVGTVSILTNTAFDFADSTAAYETREISFTIENLSSDTALALTGSPLVELSGTDSGQFSISQLPASSIAAGDATVFSLKFSPTSSGTKTSVLTIANNDSTESSYVINVSAAATPFAPLGIALADDFAATGADLVSDSYLAPRSAAAAAIIAGDDITVESGATLTIYEGVTLDMDGYQFIVNGTLDVRGSDSARVKFTHTGGSSIYVSGVANINGVYITGPSSGYAINIAGSDFSLTNSRILHSGTGVGVRMSSPTAGSNYTFENNVFVFTSTSGNQAAIDQYNAVNPPGITMTVRYNTFIGKGSAGYAVYFRDDETSTYLIENNLVASGLTSPFYVAGFYFTTSTPIVSVVNNVYDDSGTDRTLLDGAAVDVDTDNLEFTGWDNSVVFENYSANDFRMKQTSNYPNLSQADSITALVGSLTNGSSTEVGAYGNGGYPPDWNE